MPSWLNAHWLDALLRTLAFCAAIPILSAGYLTYEGDAEEAQNWLEEAWIRFDDLRQETLTRQAAFIGIVATKTVFLLDRIFGTRLVSVPALSSALALCLSSSTLFFLLPLALHFVGGKGLGLFGAVPVLLFESLFTVGGLYLLSLVLAPLANKDRRHLTKDLFTFVTTLPVIVVPYLIVTRQWGDAVALLAVWFACSAGVLATLLIVGGLRWSAVKATSGKREWPFVLLSFLPLAVAGAMIVMFGYSPVLDGEENLGYTTFVLITAASTSLALAPTFFVLAIAMVLLLHRWLWPLAVRLFHNVPQAHLFENKPFLRKVGYGLPLVGFFRIEKAANLAHKGVPELMASIGKLF